MRSFRIAVVLFLLSASTSASQYFNVEKVADGVYAAIGKPGVASNAALIVLNDGVLVVDTHLRPYWTRDLIAEIGRLAGKPVRYVVNTHWHNDHTQGNRTYLDAFPSGTEFIGHIQTREDILAKAIPSIQSSLESVPKTIADLRQHLETGLDDDGRPLNEEQKAQMRQQVSDLERYLEELKSLTITLPNLTFDRSLVLHSGSRQVQILHFGMGHTRGDVVVYLPTEKVLVSGDLLTGGLPFMRDAVPTAWGPTLESVGRLDLDRVIPGHGPVQSGKDRLNLVVRYLNDLNAAVRSQVNQGAALEEAKQRINLIQYESEFQNFKNGLAANIERLYLELTGKLAGN